MVTVTEHTRRKSPGLVCMACGALIEPGQVYRQLIAVTHDAFNRPFVRQTAHRKCVERDEWWTLTLPKPVSKLTQDRKTEEAP